MNSQFGFPGSIPMSPSRSSRFLFWFCRRSSLFFCSFSTSLTTLLRFRAVNAGKQGVSTLLCFPAVNTEQTGRNNTLLPFQAVNARQTQRRHQTAPLPDCQHGINTASAPHYSASRLSTQDKHGVSTTLLLLRAVNTRQTQCIRIQKVGVGKQAQQRKFIHPPKVKITSA